MVKKRIEPCRAKLDKVCQPTNPQCLNDVYVKDPRECSINHAYLTRNRKEPDISIENYHLL